jgi:predicted SnoaL-like aldol condensation-catalyzing enzyme
LKLLILAAVFSAVAAGAQTPEQKRIQLNKDVVRNFYVLAFNKQQPAEAMKLYGGPTYKQHNPHAPDGKDAFVQFFTEFYKTKKDTSVEIKRMIAEGDYVVVHVHSKLNKQDIGSAVMDIFRLENGKLVEHWDVMQQVPKNAANKNTMF